MRARKRDGEAREVELAGSEAPPFWFEPAGWKARALWPLSWLYGRIARRRLDSAVPMKVNAPVICIGNLTVGGTGKTPTALALADIAIKHKFRPGFVSRGYGGTHIKPHLVDLEKDVFSAVGDEPLLLARKAPTMIGRNRGLAAQKLLDAGCDFIIMDDGFQSRTLHYDYALVTLDARRGIGNGKVIPAGPVRAPLRDQMRLTDTVLRIGEGDAGDAVIRAASRAAKPIMQAWLKPANLRAISGKQVLAYSGIGDPNKFYETLSTFGCWLGSTRSFPDHHVFTQAEAQELLDKAKSENLCLVTTEKDAVRLQHYQGALDQLREQSHVLPVSLVFETKVDGETIINSAVERYELRRIRSATEH